MAQDNWVPIKSTSARSMLKAALIQRKIKSNVSLSDGDGGSIEDITTSAGASGRKIAGSMFASESSLEVRDGRDVALDALDAYLKYLERRRKASGELRNFNLTSLNMVYSLE